MCLSKAYVGEEEESDVLLEDVASVEREGDELVFSTILGEEKRLKATIKRVDFSNNEIYVKEGG